jgi:hypothetical protein
MNVPKCCKWPDSAAEDCRKPLTVMEILSPGRTPPPVLVTHAFCTTTLAIKFFISLILLRFYLGERLAQAVHRNGEKHNIIRTEQHYERLT